LAGEAALEVQEVVQRRARRNMMTPKELADALENIDEESFCLLAIGI
jgi:hypothetical protein